MADSETSKKNDPASFSPVTGYKSLMRATLKNRGLSVEHYWKYRLIPAGPRRFPPVNSSPLKRERQKVEVVDPHVQAGLHDRPLLSTPSAGFDNLMVIDR